MNDKRKEALLRLSMLEDLYGLNPKVKKYFQNNRLYYSYITMGGTMGCIDTINYDKRYPIVVEQFETNNNSLVYHVIEQGNQLVLLYVSDNSFIWTRERPFSNGIFACIYDFDDDSYETGYIKIDMHNGALYRKNTAIYDYSEIQRTVEEWYEYDSEIMFRLRLLISQGILTDIDICETYKERKEICRSELRNVSGIPVGVIDYISSNKRDELIVNKVFCRVLKSDEIIPFFVIKWASSYDYEMMSVLYVSKDRNKWIEERQLLEKRKSKAVIIDLSNANLFKAEIEYDFSYGGPYMVSVLRMIDG